MSFIQRINQDITAAMKNKEAEKLSTLRMVKAALMNFEIEKKGKANNPEATIDDAEAIKVLQTLVKQRRDSVEQYEQGGRPELAEKEASEIKFIETYLPAAMDEATVAKIVEEAISETGASSMKDLGNVMKAVMAKAAGRMLDGKIVNQLVRLKLGG
ncbi:MAG: GatB/YqeY domain-containing protein [Acidobacteriota bacterium]|nr:GatB/YqeY domain-containing protein [Acidobacteriota bacterium]